MTTPTPDSRECVVELKSVAKSFADLQVLNNVSLRVEKGSRISILGPGGSGKSTLLKIMLGIIPPTSGEVHILGQDLSTANIREIQEVRRRIGMAFQQGALFDFLHVRDNIRFAMDNMTSVPREEADARIDTMLSAVHLPHAANKLPSELSGGMRRRVGIVRAMATRPELALLDEPTAGLDPVTSRIVIDMIHNLAESVDATCVCVTASVEVAFSFASQVAILREGEIVAQGTWEELHKIDDPWILHFLDIRGFTPPQGEEHGRINTSER